MDHVAKRYWTLIPAQFHTEQGCEGSRSDAAGGTLRIDVTGVDVSLSEVLRGRVVRRVLLALSRFGPRLRKVTVSLAEPVNPLGGVDQQCRMRAWLPESDDIHAEAINGGFEAAVARAAAQLAKRVDFALDGGAGDGAKATPGAGGRAQRRRAPETAPRGPRRRPPLRPRRRARSS